MREHMLRFGPRTIVPLVPVPRSVLDVPFDNLTCPAVPVGEDHRVRQGHRWTLEAAGDLDMGAPHLLVRELVVRPCVTSSLLARRTACRSGRPPVLILNW